MTLFTYFPRLPGDWVHLHYKGEKEAGNQAGGFINVAAADRTAPCTIMGTLLIPMCPGQKTQPPVFISI